MTVTNTQLPLRLRANPATQTASDVVLILGQGDQMQSFSVASEAITRASQPFEAMLHKNYKEARPSDGSRWVVHLPEDDPEAFGIIVDIINLNTDELPRKMSLRLFYNICVLAEKYLMLHVLRKHVRRWYDEMWWYVYRRNGQIDPDEIQQHTSIACLLGDHKSLWAAMTYYAYACRVVDGELVHWRKDPLLSGNETQSEVGEITEYRKLLAEELPLLPAICFDIIRALRLELLENIMGTEEFLGWLGSVFCFGEGEHSRACELDDLSETDCEKVVFAQIQTIMNKYGLTDKAPFLLSGDWAASVNELVECIHVIPERYCIRAIAGNYCEPFPLFRKERAASGPSWYWNTYYRTFEATLKEGVYIRPKSSVVNQYKAEIERHMEMRAKTWVLR